MKLARLASAGAFLARAGSFLAAREAHNCLPLGIATQISVQPDLITLPPYFAVIEAGGEVAAAAVMTPPWRLVVAYAESPEGFDRLGEDVRDFAPGVPGVNGPAPVSRWFSERWQALTGQAPALHMAERIYALTRVNHPAAVPGRARRATLDDRPLLVDWWAGFQQEAFGEVAPDVGAQVDRQFAMRTRGIYLWEDAGRPVSMAGFGGPTPRGIRIGPVYTPPAFRGRGYASACTARLSQDLLDGGRTYCFLYTDLKNRTSNHIYQAIGYESVCDVEDYTFAPA